MSAAPGENTPQDATHDNRNSGRSSRPVAALKIRKVRLPAASGVRSNKRGPASTTNDSHNTQNPALQEASPAACSAHSWRFCRAESRLSHHLSLVQDQDLIQRQRGRRLRMKGNIDAFVFVHWACAAGRTGSGGIENWEGGAEPGALLTRTDEEAELTRRPIGNETDGRKPTSRVVLVKQADRPQEQLEITLKTCNWNRGKKGSGLTSSSF